MPSGRLVIFAVSSALVLAGSTCCCLGFLTDLPAVPSTEAEDAEIERVARARAEQEGRTLLASESLLDAGVDAATAADAGTRRSGCVSGVGALALDLGLAVVSRGHAGGSPGAQVTFNPAACARRLVVHLVREAAGWTVVALVVIDATTEEVVAQSGTPFELVEPDVDYGSDEFF